ncbi:YadA C-terminal domain-containing protein [Vibrio europaeus]|uniref:YadA C-terminal domain-containing protein n=1 Tax=Vibrio europaeus TaxID=300876 RepID=UPI00234020E8|nr:YadA C-terminal domain-containing protein [Vibrio europaeus]MDC5851985.1 YadA C-terminal domain-containing protein [Vibrio europaeus]
MKKTILALTVTSLFSGAALAEKSPNYDYVVVETSELEKAVEGIKEDPRFYRWSTSNKEIDPETGRTYYNIADDTGKTRGMVYVDENGNKVIDVFKDYERNDGKPLEVDSTISIDKSGNNSIISVDDGSNWKPNNDIINNLPNPDENARYMDTDIAVEEANNYISENNLVVNDDGQVYDENGVQVGQVSTDNNGNVNVTAFNFEKGGKDSTVTIESAGNDQVKITGKETSAGNNSENKVIDETGDIVDHIDEQIAINERNEANAQAAYDWARQAQEEFKQEVARLDSKIDTMEGRVSNGTAMVGAMSQMQFGRDGLGIGAGVSQFNGSKAVAVGVGYAFGTEKQWMAKGSFGYAESRKGKGSKDTMAAAGVTYSFK